MYSDMPISHHHVCPQPIDPDTPLNTENKCQCREIQKVKDTPQEQPSQNKSMHFFSVFETLNASDMCKHLYELSKDGQDLKDIFSTNIQQI